MKMPLTLSRLSFVFLVIMMSRYSLLAKDISIAEQSPQLSGRIYLIFYRTDNPSESNNNVYFNTIDVGLKGRLLDYLRYRTIMKLDKKSLKFVPLDAYCAIKILPSAELRIGQFKPPFSMERLIPSPKRDFVIPAMATKLLPSRDIGIALFGETDHIEFNLGILNGAGFNEPEDNSKKDFVGRLIFKPLKKTKTGGAIYWGWQGPDTSITKKRRYSFQAELKYPEFHIRGEYTHAEDGDVKRKSYYIQTGYKFAMGNKYLQNLEPLIRYEKLNSHGNAQEDKLTTITLGTNLYFYEHKFKYQVNYLFEKGKSFDATRHKLYVGLQVSF